MRKQTWTRLVALLLVLVTLNGCSGASTPTTENSTPPSSSEPATPEQTNPNESEHEHNYNAGEAIAPTCTADGYTRYVCDCGDSYNDDFVTKLEHTFEETVIAPTKDSEGYTLYICSICSYSIKDNYTEKVVDDGLTESQKNSLAMLNYLATLSREVNASQNSRIYLEEAYASLINNTNPENVNEVTESHLCSLLDTIEDYRLIAVKRERLEYLYNQNKASALRSAIPNPVSVLSAASSLDLKRLVASVAYMAIDSVSSYNAYNDELDQAFLQDGWTLDDEAATAMHESRKYAFQYMLQIVRDEKLPEELTLNERSVDNFVTWTNNDNVYQRLQFLESNEETYRVFGNYWLELADCYYELEDYSNCLDAIAKYEEYQADIFRKDYYLAQAMPKAIAAAAEVFKSDRAAYISAAEKYLGIINANTENNEWALRFFAAQVYLDLYTKTKDTKYLDEAYDLVLNNVNFLVNEQKELTATYLAEVKTVSVPDNATKKEKEQIKDYNSALKETRKTELPPVYEPLVLNCELLFALIDKVDVSATEKAKIKSILDTTGQKVFLSAPLASRYSFTGNEVSVEASFEKTELIVPVSCLSANSVIQVIVTDGGKSTVYDDWTIKSVDRPKEGGFTAFTATYKSDTVKDQKWSADSTITVNILDEPDSAYDPYVINFKVSSYKKIAFIETIKFEQVK